MSGQMQIVINADDFGRHTDVNHGIIEAHCHGVVTSASLLVNFESSTEAARLALENPGLHIGLHFNLSSGYCVAPKAKVTALVDEEGRFRFDTRDVPGSMARLRKVITEDSQVLDQIEREFWAQLERFQGFGLAVTHLDVHHYLSLIHIDLFEKYAELANQLAIPFRGMCYPVIDMLHVPQDVVAEMEAIVHQSASPTPQISLGNLVGSKPIIVPSKEEYQQTVEARLQNLASEGMRSVELITHPAKITEFVRLHDTYLWARELETALVNSPSFARFLEVNRFRLVPHTCLGG
jgi:predicted glycoside hydrolase/deacetylase ChbG (UPF0249 family)